MPKSRVPDSLNICLVGHRIQILSRTSDHGFLWPIARGLAKQGHNVTVISTRSPLGKVEVEREGVKAFFLQEDTQYSHLAFDDLAFRKFKELHKVQPFHIVHSLDNSGYIIGKYKRELGVAMAYDIDATQMSQLFSILGMGQENLRSLLTTAAAVAYKFLRTYFGRDRKLLKTADGVFVTNPQQRIILERYYLYPDYHIYQVPYGVDVGDLNPKEKSVELKKKLNLPENSQTAVTISDMTEIREIIPLLQAFERVAIKKPNAYLIIVGNGPYYKDIEFEVLKRALGSRVIMPGAVKNLELMDYILVGDVYINLSARTTGFEPSMIEAMAQKRVIIGSEVSPIANVVEDGVDGFLIRPADTDTLTHLLIGIFSGDMPVDDIGEKARAKVVDLFDTQKMIQSVSEAYRNILLRRSHYRA
jgi:1,2-diacylglycerol 3-alpha-glucosyltransferase